MERHRRSLSILSHLVSVVEVVGQGRLLVLVHQIWVGGVGTDGYRQQAVHDDVCISVGRRADGTGGDSRCRDERSKAFCSRCATRDVTPPDGRREVCVDGGSQAVVVEVAVHARAEVDSLHHAASGQDPQQCVEVGEAAHGGNVQGVGQSLGRVGVDLHILVNGSTEVQSYCSCGFVLFCCLKNFFF